MQEFNTQTQQDEEVEWSSDANNEIVATFENGDFVKFPAVKKKELAKLVEAHQEANEGKEVITKEVLAQQAKAKAQVEEAINNL